MERSCAWLLSSASPTQEDGVKRIIHRTAPFVVVAGLALAAASGASATQGGFRTGSGWNGTRANISGSAGVPSNGGGIATVRVQSAVSTTAGLFQFGHLKEGASFSSDCGSAVIGFMVEWSNVNGSLA